MPQAISAQVTALLDATARFDEVAVEETLTRSRESLSLARWLDEVALTFLQSIGDAWEAGTISVAHEHFASQIVRQHLAALARSQPRTEAGPLALLACPAGERHDIALQAFSVLLLRAGWRVRFLGQDTPLPALAVACRMLTPDLVVVAATRSTAIDAHATPLRLLAGEHRLAIAGRGAWGDTVDRLADPGGAATAGPRCRDGRPRRRAGRRPRAVGLRGSWRGTFHASVALT